MERYKGLNGKLRKGEEMEKEDNRVSEEPGSFVQSLEFEFINFHPFWKVF